MKKICIYSFLISIMSLNVQAKWVSVNGLSGLIDIVKNIDKTTGAGYLEEVKQTLEMIQQTENQIIMLENDALNLKQWAESILQAPMNLSKEYIDQVQKIQDNADTILSNIDKFSESFQKTFPSSYSNMTIQDILANKEKIMQDSQSILDHAFALTTQDQNILDRAKSLQDLAEKTKKPQGALEAQQTSNQIGLSQATSLTNLEQIQSEQLKLQALQMQLNQQEQKRWDDMMDKTIKSANQGPVDSIPQKIW